MSQVPNQKLQIRFHDRAMPEWLSAEAQGSLLGLMERIDEQAQYYLGYPNALDLEANVLLGELLKYPINNVGDPYVPNTGINTCRQEQEILEFFLHLLSCEAVDRWGYVTNGGTEGNTYGLLLGRDIFPDGVLFYSRDSHYCLPKIAHMLRFEAVEVRSQICGEIDYTHLAEELDKRCAKTGRPAIVNANIGTTMKGAIDKPSRILAILDELGIHQRHIHCDGALHGAMLPLLDGAPVADFRLPIGSMSVSGHKFTGSPIPCGLAVTRKATIREAHQSSWQRANSAEYVGSIDTTISGSRDGISVLCLWLQVMRLGLDGFRRRAEQCMAVAQYAKDELQQIGLPCYRHPYSNVVVFPHPSEALVQRWMLATEGPQLAHVVVMPGSGEDKISRFIAELKVDPDVRNNATNFPMPTHLL